VKIYTKTGDGGKTRLVGGSEVQKDDDRVSAYGDVDELNALLGVVRASSGDTELSSLLEGIQRDLFALGAQLADPTSGIGEQRPKAALTAEHVARLERAIDAREALLPPLRAFILPGGSSVGALLHLARATCRRAERSVVGLSRTSALDPIILPYLNRLSDLLFVLARYTNHFESTGEETW
jgi:cob(I)alamin adenosyltransferase